MKRSNRKTILDADTGYHFTKLGCHLNPIIKVYNVHFHIPIGKLAMNSGRVKSSLVKKKKEKHF